MLSRLDAPHELGEKIQSTNLATERHQALEALRVVATNDRQIPSSHKTSKSDAGTEIIALARRSAPVRAPQQRKNTSDVRS